MALTDCRSEQSRSNFDRQTVQSERIRVSVAQLKKAIDMNTPAILNAAREASEIKGAMYQVVQHALTQQLRPLEESMQALQLDLAVRPALRQRLHDETRTCYALNHVRYKT